MFRGNINTRWETIKFIRRFLFYFNTYNLHTSSNNGSLIILCCPTHRVMFMSCRLVFVTSRLMFMSRRLVFVTRRLTFMLCRIVFATRRVQKCSYIKFSKSLFFVSSSQSPTGLFFPQSIHLFYIGVLWSIRVRNYLCSSFWFDKWGFAKVVLIVDYVSPYSYDDSMCVLWWL